MSVKAMESCHIGVLSGAPVTGYKEADSCSSSTVGLAVEKDS